MLQLVVYRDNNVLNIVKTLFQTGETLFYLVGVGNPTAFPEVFGSLDNEMAGAGRQDNQADASGDGEQDGYGHVRFPLMLSCRGIREAFAERDSVQLVIQREDDILHVVQPLFHFFEPFDNRL